MYTQTGWMCPEPGQVRLNGKEKMTLVSCGRFRLLRRQMAETVRPDGRQDWQIIYVKSGAGDYWTDGECRHVTEGHIILYRPGEPQRYRNELADQPDIYWVHFAGTEVDSELERLGFSQGHIFYVGSSREYDKVINLLEIFDGNIPVILYLCDTQKKLAVPRRLYTSGHPLLYRELERLLGKGNVATK